MSDTPALDAWRKEMSGRVKPDTIVKDVAPLGTILSREKIMIPTPHSQRRCYNGCFPSSDWEFVWSEWSIFSESSTEEKAEFLDSLSKKSQYKWEVNKPTT